MGALAARDALAGAMAGLPFRQNAFAPFLADAGAPPQTAEQTKSPKAAKAAKATKAAKAGTTKKTKKAAASA